MSSVPASRVLAPAPVDWPLVWDRSKYWAWTVTTKMVVGLIYLAVISQGLRNVFPEMGYKLSKIPCFWFLAYFKATYRLDLAWGGALLPLTLTFVLWIFILKMYLTPDKFSKVFRNSNTDGWKKVFGILGAVIIVADACLFYACFVHGSWGRGKFSVAGILATAAYIAILVAVNLVSLYLSEQIANHNEEQ